MVIKCFWFSYKVPTEEHLIKNKSTSESSKGLGSGIAEDKEENSKREA